MSPLETEEGMLVSSSIRDITAQKQASQYARSLIEASLDPLVTISPEGKITDVNEATAKITGVRREELIGTDFANYFTEPEKAREGYQQTFAKGFVTDYPLTIRHKDGRLFHVLYNASVYRDVNNNVLGVFAAARDITPLKKAEVGIGRSTHSGTGTARRAREVSKTYRGPRIENDRVEKRSRGTQAATHGRVRCSHERSDSPYHCRNADGTPSTESSAIENAQRTTLNILEDFAAEKCELESGQRATLNILEDFDAEKKRMAGAERAVLNILEDFATEKSQLEEFQHSFLNILDDFSQEKASSKARSARY